SSRRPHTISYAYWSSDVCSSDLGGKGVVESAPPPIVDCVNVCACAKEGPSTGAVGTVCRGHVEGAVCRRDEVSPPSCIASIGVRSEEVRVGKVCESDRASAARFR